MPVFSYSCAILNWSPLEINNLDTKTRKLQTIHKIFSKNQCKLRLYSPRRECGDGVMEFNQVHRTLCVGLAEDVNSSTDFWMRFVHGQENKLEKGSLLHWATNFKKKVQLMDTTQENKTEANPSPMIAKKKKKKKDCKNKYQQIYSNKWENDKSAGRC